MTDAPSNEAGGLVALFMELASISSPSRRERAAADLVTARLRGLGLEVVEDDAAQRVGGDTGNLRCVVRGRGASPSVCLAAHLDTVEPSGPIRPALNDGVIRSSSGTILGADNKAAVAALVTVTEGLVVGGDAFPTFELIFSVAEEVGVLGSRFLAPDLPAAPIAAVFDSSGPVGGIVVRAPSQQTIRATFRGQAAHAGLEPENGRSAIQAAAHAISLMELGRLGPETTANVGMIEGGVAQNIVPESCRVVAECRSLDDEMLAATSSRMIDALQLGAARVGTDLDLDVVTEYRAFRLDESSAVVGLARRAIEALGLPARTHASGGGSDANVFNGRGTPTVNFDCGMSRVHTAEESMDVAQLVLLGELVRNVIVMAEPAGGGRSGSEGVV
ncbi:MAG TPA: M20/M25/M40 family metallo-hydrolase [Thermoleophilia bacterium]|nr:M20/M25/M40 family metallo-hydrolase [Thermoleophilia bacterium]